MKPNIKIFSVTPIGINLDIPHASTQFLNYEFGINNWEYASEYEADLFVASSGEENIKHATLFYEKYQKPILHLHITHSGDDQDIAFKNWNPYLGNKSFIVSDMHFTYSIDKYLEIIWMENLYNDYRLGYDKPNDLTYIDYFYWHSEYKTAHQKINLSTDCSLKSKIYVAPNKTHPADPTRSHIRKKLMKLLIDEYSELGYIGNSDASPYWLCDNSYTTTDIADLEAITKSTISPMSYGQNTPNYLYYQHSYLSVYGETIEGTNNNNCLLMTEKTLNPIMNLHFILPFSSKHYIRYLREHKNIMFPKEIDYSYDNVDSMCDRWDLYEKELKRLLNLSLQDWKTIFEKNIDVLKHNQSVLINNKIRKNNILQRIQSYVIQPRN